MVIKNMNTVSYLDNDIINSRKFSRTHDLIKDTLTSCMPNDFCQVKEKTVLPNLYNDTTSSSPEEERGDFIFKMNYTQHYMDDDNNLKKCSTGHELYAVTSPPRHSVMMTSPSQYEVPMTSTPYYDVTMTSIPSYDVQMALTPRYHGPITSGPRCDVPMNSTPRSDVTGVKCHSLGKNLWSSKPQHGAMLQTSHGVITAKPITEEYNNGNQSDETTQRPMTFVYPENSNQSNKLTHQQPVKFLFPPVSTQVSRPTTKTLGEPLEDNRGLFKSHLCYGHLSLAEIFPGARPWTQKHPWGPLFNGTHDSFQMFPQKSYIVKNFTCGERCSFGPSSFFESNCSFGDNCQFGYECTFGSNCTFGNGCRFAVSSRFGERCSFGKNCKIGKKSVVNSFCTFGSGCEIAKCCVVKHAVEIHKFLDLNSAS